MATQTHVLAGLDVVVYINNISIWSDRSYKDHLQKVEEVLKRLANNGLKTNPLKCEWAVEHSNFLGFDISPTYCKPMWNKIDALL